MIAQNIARIYRLQTICQRIAIWYQTKKHLLNIRNTFRADRIFVEDARGWTNVKAISFISIIRKTASVICTKTNVTVSTRIYEQFDAPGRFFQGRSSIFLEKKTPQSSPGICRTFLSWHEWNIIVSRYVKMPRIQNES